MRQLYTFVLWLLQPLLRRKLARRGVLEPGYLQAVEERFGRYRDPPWAAGRTTIWVHAVSLGETRAAAVLVACLRERLPAMRLLLTHGTATGRAEGAKLLRAGDVQTWQPLDTPAAVARFLDQFKPRIGILMETEVWPNLAALCQRKGMPLVLANARLSAASLQRARRLGWLARPAYRRLSAVWAQTQDDAARFAVLGAPVRGVFGNLKFDAAPDAALLARGQAWRADQARPVVLLASSREGEEAALLQILRSRQGRGAGSDAIQWLLVPRHPQRFDEVAALIEAQGFAVARRSAWRDDGPPHDPRQDGCGANGADQAPRRATVWLGDSLGEMALYYGLAEVALLGGSFEPLGGQNLIEAAACACPVVMGPHTFNFAEAAELAVSAGAALRVPSLFQALVAVQELLNDPPALASMVTAADEFSKAHRGAVEKTLAAVLALLGQQDVDAL